MHQHLPAIHSRNPKAFGGYYEWRGAGAIDEVDDGTRPRKALEVEWEFVFTGEPEASRIHDQIEVAVIDVGRALRHAYAIPTDPTRHRSGPLNRTIENQYVFGLLIYQAE